MTMTAKMEKKVTTMKKLSLSGSNLPFLFALVGSLNPLRRAFALGNFILTFKPK